MKDAHREKLRQLPRERKLYLLQQNQHIKENKTDNSSALRKNMPTSNSSTSLFPPKAFRQKSAIKRSDTSSRSLFNGKSGNSSKQDLSSSRLSLASSFATNNSSTEDLFYFMEDGASAPPTPNSVASADASAFFSSYQNNASKEDLNVPPSPRATSSARLSKRKPSLPDTSVKAVSAAVKENETTTSNTASPNTPTPSQQSAGDKRAATYKFARQNLSETVAFDSINRSKVGSMILEFDALAQDSTASDESAAWLLLDNKTLPRQNSIALHNNSSRYHHPSLNHLFPSAGTSPPSHHPTMPRSESSTSLLANSYAYQSLTRKDGSRLASLSTTVSSTVDEKRSSRDRNSPYYYVERLRSR